MSAICPTVTTNDPAVYAKQLRLAESLSPRVHIDLADGVLAPVELTPASKVWWDYPLIVDLHVMHQRPNEIIDQLIHLKPHMVVIHAEAEVHHALFAAELHRAGIKAGLAVLQNTAIEPLENMLVSFDHLLIFSGDLGHFGGSVDLSLLSKATTARSYHPTIEIGWDGGINADNIAALRAGGVDVCNVGGFIQKADNPQEAYATLEAAIIGDNNVSAV